MIEEGLDSYPLSKLLCQMRVTNLRVRIPYFTIRSQNPPVNLSEILGPNNSSGTGENPRLIQNVVLDVADADVDGDVHENFFRSEDSDDDDDEPNDEEEEEEEEDMKDEGSTSEEDRVPRRKGFRRKYRKVNLDRPFIVYVEDSSVGTVFMGRVNTANPIVQEETPTSSTSILPEVEVTTVVPDSSSSSESPPPK